MPVLDMNPSPLAQWQQIDRQTGQPLGPPMGAMSWMTASELTTINRNDSRLSGNPQWTGHPRPSLVLSDLELARGFVAPVRTRFVHKTCLEVTSLGNYKVAQTMARQPDFYDKLYCRHCKADFPIVQFNWEGTDITVGS